MVKTMFFRDLFILLWTLLLIVPGIIKSYSYRLVPYILSENPHMDRKRALELSQQMMDGHKMEAFVLELSFFGWFLLSALTCGLVGIFYVNPYLDATFAEFYVAIRTESIGKGLVAYTFGNTFFLCGAFRIYLSGDIVAGSNCGRDSGQRSVFDRDMDSTGSIWGR